MAHSTPITLPCRPIVGFESLYEVDTDSNIYRVAPDRMGRHQGQRRLLKHIRLPNGYLCVSLSGRDGIKHRKYVHRLVAEAFIHTIPNGYDVNHINGVKSDNHLVNLEIITHLANVQHAIHVLGVNTGCPLHGEDNGMAKLTAPQVDAIRRSYKSMMQGRSGRVRARRGWATAIAEQYGITTTQICNITSGRSWPAEAHHGRVGAAYPGSQQGEPSSRVG